MERLALKNPYSDTRILNGDPQTKVKTILVGIDIETPEILLANELRQKGQKIDLVLAHAGIGTIISMHASEKHVKETAKHHINRVVAGHISSDSLGLNLFLDKLEKEGIQILPCSGLIRVSRN